MKAPVKTAFIILLMAVVAGMLTWAVCRYSGVLRMRLEYSIPVMERLIHTAASALRASFERGEIFPPPEIDNRIARGIAVRFTRGGRDRACLAYWKAVRDLEGAVRSAVYLNRNDPRYEPLVREELTSLVVEITVFGKFKRVSGPFDFLPGMETMLLEYNGNTTLIQASLVPERNWTKTRYIEAICRKAGLSPDAWRNPDLKWYRAPSVSRELPYREALDL